MGLAGFSGVAGDHVMLAAKELQVKPSRKCYRTAAVRSRVLVDRYVNLWVVDVVQALSLRHVTLMPSVFLLQVVGAVRQ